MGDDNANFVFKVPFYLQLWFLIFYFFSSTFFFIIDIFNVLLQLFFLKLKIRGTNFNFLCFVGRVRITTLLIVARIFSKFAFLVLIDTRVWAWKFYFYCLRFGFWCFFMAFNIDSFSFCNMNLLSSIKLKFF